MQLDERIVLITGANRGIGKEIGRQMLARNWKVIVTARNFSKASEVVSELGGSAIALRLDVQDENSVKLAAKEISEKFGRLDVLVNNAAVIGNSDVLDFDLSQIANVMDTNLMGPIRTSKYFMPLLQKSDDGRIINISSQMGQITSLHSGGYGAYRLSKAALNSFTIMLAAELKGSSVKAYAMSPGWVKTEMGGKNAPRSVEKGAETVIWLATEKNITPGKFYQDKKTIDW